MQYFCFMRFVCFLFSFGPDSLKLFGLRIEANFMGYLVAVFLTEGTAVMMNFPVGVVQDG